MDTWLHWAEVGDVLAGEYHWDREGPRFTSFCGPWRGCHGGVEIVAARDHEYVVGGGESLVELLVLAGPGGGAGPIL